MGRSRDVGTARGKGLDRKEEDGRMGWETEEGRDRRGLVFSNGKWREENSLLWGSQKLTRAKSDGESLWGGQDSGILETRKSTLALSPKGAALSKDGSLSQNRGRWQQDTQGQAGAFMQPRGQGRRAAQECRWCPGREQTRGLPLGQTALGSHGGFLLP